MKQNVQKITIIKVLATAFVLYIHGANIYGYAGMTMPIFFRPFAGLVNTAVPLFFAISGYLVFSKDLNFKSNLKKKFQRLGIPFLIWNSVYFLLEFVEYLVTTKIYGGQEANTWGILSALRLFFGIPFYTLPFYNPAWYIRDLFLLSTIAPLCQKTLKKFAFPLLVAIVILWFLPVNTYFRQAFSFFFLGGLLAKNSHIRDVLLKKRNSIFVIITFLLAIFTSVPDSSVLNQLSSCFFAHSIYQICAGLENNETVINWSNRILPYSYAIFYLHGKFLSIVQMLLVSRIPSLVYVGYIVIPAVVFIICFWIAVTFKRLLPKVFKLCMGET